MVSLTETGMASAQNAGYVPQESLFGTGAPGRWHLLRTKSRQEKALSQSLQCKGVMHYLPLVKQKRTRGKQKITIESPLFPGYLFLRGSIDDCYEADRTSRVVQILAVNDQEKLNWELRNLDLAITSEAQLDPYPYLVKGIRVVVRSGPLQGMEGIIESRTKNDRLILQVDVLGQATSLEIDAALLEPLE